jgi:hypothetical protein
VGLVGKQNPGRCDRFSHLPGFVFMVGQFQAAAILPGSFLPFSFESVIVVTFL